MKFYNKILDFAKEHKKVAAKISKTIKLKNKSILDVGGGSGLLEYYLKEYTKKITILEPSKKMTDCIEDDFKIINETFQKYNSKEKFDIVIIYDSLHHIPEDSKNKREEIRKAINKMIDLTKEKVIIIEPNTNTLRGKWIKFQENTLMKLGTYFPTIEEYKEFLEGRNYSIEIWSKYLVIKITCQ